MTVSEDDIIYSYGKIRETLKYWIEQKYTPKSEDLQYLINSYPDEVGDGEDE